MFDAVTAVSPWEVPARRRTQLIGGALGLHAAAITIYLVATLWSIAPVSAPDLIDAFIVAPPPPQVTFVPTVRPPASGPVYGPDRPAPAPETPSVEPAIVQPESVATLEAAVPGLESVVANAGSIDVAGGVDIGVPTSGTLSTGALDATSTIFVPGQMTAPRILHRVEPVYPEMARRVRREGVVVIEAEIGRDGLLRSARTVNAPLGLGLEQAALDALKQWRFTPAEFRGKPISVFYRLSVNFRVH